MWTIEAFLGKNTVDHPQSPSYTVVVGAVRSGVLNGRGPEGERAVERGGGGAAASAGGGAGAGRLGEEGGGVAAGGRGGADGEEHRGEMVS